MKRFFYTIIGLFATILTMSAQTDTTMVNLDEIVVSSFYSTTISAGDVIETDELISKNYGQEPSNYFTKMPGIISMNDNGTEFGYGYFRIRGLDQTRINVTLDGCPWNEAEDYGAYFANSPDLMSSMHSIKVDKGTSSSYNGIAGVAGGISLESVNLYRDTTSYFYAGSGSFGTWKTSLVYTASNPNGWGVHMKFTHQQTDGFRDYGFNKSEAATIKVGYKFNENSTIDFLTMNGWHANGQGWIGNTLEELELNPHANGNTEAETDNWFMSMNRLQYKHRFEKTVLTATTYYQFQDGSYRMDLDNYMKRMVGEVTNTGALYDYGLKHNMIGGNVAAKHYLNKVNVSYGVNAYHYMRDHFMDDMCKNVSAEENYYNTGKKTDVSVYGIVTYKPIKQLSISGNVQYRHVNFRYVDHLNSEMSFNDLGTVWDFCNFGTNVEYILINSVKIYGSFNQVHREPTRSDMFGGNESFTGELATVKPETANDIELGVEYQTGKLYANVNAYYMIFKDELILNGEYGLNGLPCHDNADKSYRRGIEAEVDWNFIGDWNVRGAFSYSDNTVITNTFGKKNHILTPDITLDADIYYETDKVNIGGNLNYRSEMFVNLENTNTIPYLLTVNAYASYKFTENVECGLRWNNITNRVNYSNGAVGPNGETLYFRNAPSNVNVYFKYIF